MKNLSSHFVWSREVQQKARGTKQGKGNTRGGVASSYKTKAPLLSSTCSERISLDLRGQKQDTPNSRLRFSGNAMDGVLGVVKDIHYVSLMRMGNGELMEIITLVSTSIEEHEGRLLAAVRIFNPSITNTHEDRGSWKTCCLWRV